MNAAGTPRSKNDTDVDAPLSGQDTGPLYERFYARLTAVAAAILGRFEGAEDIVQQAAQIAIAKNSSFDSDTGYLAWMTRTVRNCALNRVRQTKRHRTFVTDPQDLDSVATRQSAPAESPIDPDTGELAADQTCFEDELMLALQALSEDARCCLLLRTVLDMSYEDIATMLEIPAGTAMSHVFRSRQTLRKKLR